MAGGKNSRLFEPTIECPTDTRGHLFQERCGLDEMTVSIGIKSESHRNTYQNTQKTPDYLPRVQALWALVVL